MASTVEPEPSVMELPRVTPTPVLSDGLTSTAVRKNQDWEVFASGICSVAAKFPGVELTESVQAALWRPLDLSLELTAALLLVGAVYDAFGKRAAQRLLPWAVGVGLVFHMLRHALNNGFLIFVVYEGVAIVGTLALYGRLAINDRLAGASIVAAGICLTLLAGLVQVSDISIRLVVPFDHNGVFHLVQAVALVTLGHGLRVGLANVPQRAARDRL